MIVDMTKGVFRRIYSSATRDRRINQLSIGAELLYWRLHCVADDFGSFEADPYLLLCSALPLRRDFDSQQISALLDELVRMDLINLYKVNGESYGSIADFQANQPTNRSGRRICRYPQPKSATGQNDVGGNGGVMGNTVHPEQSSPHQSKSESQNENQSESKNQTHTQNVQQGQAHAPPGADAGVCENVAAQGVSEEDSATPAELAIYDAYPRHVGRSEALHAIRKALKVAELRFGANVGAAWLLETTKLFAMSPEGHAGRYCPHPATWFNAGRYDDDPNEWIKIAQQPHTLRLAGTAADKRPTTRDLPNGPTSKWGEIGQLKVKITMNPDDPRVPQWKAEIDELMAQE